MLGPRPSPGRRRRVWPWTRRWVWWCGTTGSRRSRARWAVIGGECRYSPLIGWARTTPTWTTSTPPSWGTARATWWAGMVVFTMFEEGTSDACLFEILKCYHKILLTPLINYQVFCFPELQSVKRGWHRLRKSPFSVQLSCVSRNLGWLYGRSEQQVISEQFLDSFLFLWIPYSVVASSVEVRKIFFRITANKI